MRRALEAFIVEGIETSIPMHQRILADVDFQAGNLSTKFMERFIATKAAKKSEHRAGASE